MKPGSKDYEFAKAALFERHPDMANYPAGNSTYISNLDLEIDNGLLDLNANRVQASFQHRAGPVYMLVLEQKWYFLSGWLVRNKDKYLNLKYVYWFKEGLTENFNDLSRDGELKKAEFTVLNMHCKFQEKYKLGINIST